MNYTTNLTADDNSHPFDRGVQPLPARILQRRFVLVAVAVVALVVLDQAVIQPWLVRLHFYAPVINTAGRQRMLSQKLVKESRALGQATDADGRARIAATLSETVAQWSRAQAALLAGDAPLGLQPIQSPPIVAVLRAQQPSFNAMREAAQNLLLIRQPDNTNFAEQFGHFATPLATLLEHEPQFLAKMETVVGLLEAEAASQLRWLRGAALLVAVAIVALIIAAGLLVIRPALRLLQRAHETLEQRVIQRTAQLAAANESLAAEIACREQTELRARELAAALAHASRVTSLGQLATGLAHELNQPLATITNHAEVGELLLASNGEPKQLQDAFSQIKTAALRAGGIVRRLRNFVRPGPPTTAVVDLHDLIREVAELCRPELLRAQTRLEFHLSHQALTAVVDGLQIQQVLVNLIQNAVQAMRDTPVAQRVIEIHSSALPRDFSVDHPTHARLEVRDCGSGFTAEALSKACEQFFTTQPDGLGIGLSISRSIVLRHEGRFHIENRPDTSGARVAFELPLHAEPTILSPHAAHGIYC